MRTKPTTASGYAGVQTSLVRATCLYVATKLGDLMDDLVLVGGLVPSLLIDQARLPPGVTAHVGTMDLDIGLSVVLLDQERYRAVGDRLRAAGFQPDTNEKGNPSRQRWVIEHGGTVTIDFLIAPTLEGDKGGGIRDLEQDFAAFITPGLHLAFRDRVAVPLSGQTLFGESASRTIQVCGPGAYIALKALALRLRGENKDAYDLYYVLRSYTAGVDAIAEALAALMDDAKAREALQFLDEDFAEPDSIGPTRTARFLTEDLDENIQGESVAYVRQLLRAVERIVEEKK